MGVIGNLSMLNSGSLINFANTGLVGNTAATTKNQGTTNIANVGLMNDTSLFTQGATTNVANLGFMNNLSAVDQYDKTNIYNAGLINNAALTANGALGEVNLINTGLVNNTNLSANYGGTINVDNLFGAMGTVNAFANGASHGQVSSINLLT